MLSDGSRTMKKENLLKPGPSRPVPANGTELESTVYFKEGSTGAMRSRAAPKCFGFRQRERRRRRDEGRTRRKRVKGQLFKRSKTLLVSKSQTSLWARDRCRSPKYPERKQAASSDERGSKLKCQLWGKRPEFRKAGNYLPRSASQFRTFIIGANRQKVTCSLSFFAS